jgi:hypothetical protein
MACKNKNNKTTAATPTAGTTKRPLADMTVREVVAMLKKAAETENNGSYNEFNLTIDANGEIGFRLGYEEDECLALAGLMVIVKDIVTTKTITTLEPKE